MALWRIWLYGICIGGMLVGCSDFYRSDFTHITSAKIQSEQLPQEQDSAQQKILLERKIQAMRKTQILQDEHTRAIGIAHYINDINSEIEKSGGLFADDVFYIELYDKIDEISESKLRAKLNNGYKSIESYSIERLNKNTLGILAPDITYNEVYRVRFSHLGARGRENWKLLLEIKGVGVMSFDYGYAKRKSNLAQ